MSSQQITVLTVLNGGSSDNKSKLRYNDLVNRGTIDLEMKDYPKAVRFFTASLTAKVGCNNDQRAYSLMMIGVAKYHMREYKGSKKYLGQALTEATDPRLIDCIRYDLAITDLRTGIIYKSGCDDLSWLSQASKSNQLLYVMRLIPVAIKTRNMRYIIKIIFHIIATK